MKKEEKLVLLIVGGFATILFFFRRSIRRRLKRPAGSYGTTTFTRQFYTLSESSRQTLRCRYVPNSQLRQQGVFAADIIAERMRLLQQNPQDLQQLLSAGSLNRWSPYEAIYQEAIRQTLYEDLIDPAPAGTCYDPVVGISTGGVGVDQIDLGTGQVSP